MQGKKDNRSKTFNQLAFVAEAIAALSWVTVAPAPVPYVKEMAAAGDFYGNKVLTEFKGKYDQGSCCFRFAARAADDLPRSCRDENMVNFVKTFKELINDLSAYVKDFHTTGLSWNSKALLRRIPLHVACCMLHAVALTDLSWTRKALLHRIDGRLGPMGRP